jgi:uncharacterized phage protein gp47/JayE
MTTFEDGIYLNDTQEQILDAMIADAKEYFGEDLKDDELAAIRLFYAPIAIQFANAQEDIGLVLQSAQIDNAENEQLDLLTALIGITRQSATHATGSVTFSRSEIAGKDYTIPSGTTVQTDSNEATKYETQETVVLAEGTTSIDAQIESLDDGVDTNTASNTVTIVPSPPAGVESVTNPAEITGGTDEEIDSSLRSRAKEELSTGSRASAPALIYGAKALDGVKSVSIFINDSNQDNTASGGLPDHSFELVVLGGNKQDIGQMILETKAAGDTSYAGANGNEVTVDSELPNGQTHPISYSQPNGVTIYIDADMKVTDEYAGDNAIRDSIVEYIGGITTGGNQNVGNILVGDDVLYGRVEYAIRDVDGVYDINSLTVGTADNPTGETDVTISNSEVATTDGTDESVIGITTQEVSFE